MFSLIKPDCSSFIFTPDLPLIYPRFIPELIQDAIKNWGLGRPALLRAKQPSPLLRHHAHTHNLKFHIFLYTTSLHSGECGSSSFDEIIAHRSPGNITNMNCGFLKISHSTGPGTGPLRTGIEPVTSRLTVARSNHLS